eukprot:TRINITY_DN2943_c0_g1_i13.p1 TRINITY_DN2943_c0_g1~~TRINITY_DN2943_c0_g1_i13.p1  ORF type:complete len:483 (-),score=78.56 TRINITY_DN2943_c0_g1_i13:83-1531(-)
MEKDCPSHFDSIESPMKAFFENQKFFITGSTGFLGKVFLHKLLMSCPGLKEKSVYLLVRGQKELSAEKRFEKDIFEDCLLFQGLLTKYPQFRSKIRVIEGDISKSKLGMSTEDYTEVVNECTLLVHMAATTNFNENLRRSVILNIHGSRRMLDLAKAVKNLRSLTHTSTCYVNATRYGTAEVREKIYPLPFDPHTVTEKILQMTEEEAERETPTIIGNHPNTYTFTKGIVEHIILEQKGNIPCSIVRPSIIGGAWQYPLPGWVDSLIGPAGLSLAAGLGALHAMPGLPDGIMDIIPVDLVVNAILAATYHTAINPPRERLPIYHIATGAKNPITWRHLASVVTGNFSRRPSSRTMSRVWIYFVNPRFYPVLHRMFHLTPAALGDLRRAVVGKKPLLFNKAQTLNNIAKSLEFFTAHEWIFGIQNLTSLWESLTPTDLSLFNFDTSKRNIDWEVYLVQFCEGLKRFLLKELSEDEENFFRSKL